MKLWIGAAVAVLAILIVFGAAVSLDTSGTSGPLSPVAIDITASPSPHPTFTFVPTLAPTPTAPLTCGFGDGDWESCAKTAIDPAVTDFAHKYAPPPNSSAVWEYYTEWPDSCLGFQQPDVACLEVITPGYRLLVRGADTPFVEYHTDLAGNFVFVREYQAEPDWALAPVTVH